MPVDSWVFIRVLDATGKTAAQIVDEQVSALGEGFYISTSDVPVGGEPALIVDGRPGFV